jgi:vacuolar-type H+-ATPase subunit E/Vma4
MMEFESIVDAQIRAMLEGIRQDLDTRREDMLSEAHGQARALLRNARRQARTRVSQAVAEERDLRDRSLQRAGAALASRIRRKQQDLDREQLKLGHDQLRQALLERWKNPDARKAWAEALLAEAGSLLNNSTWTIEYPAKLDEKEADKLLRSSGSGANVSLTANEDMQAGFRLRHDNACLDMSVRGLLAQVEEMAGELLAEIHRQQEELGAQT